MMSEIKLLYVAGAISPYPTDPPVEGYWDNIKKGIIESKRAIMAGFVPYCPFLDFIYYLSPDPPDFHMSEGLMKRLDIPWLEKCDAVLVLKKYRKSEGTKNEIATAKKLGIPVFYSLEALVEFNEMENGDD